MKKTCYIYKYNVYTRKNYTDKPAGYTHKAEKVTTQFTCYPLIADLFLFCSGFISNGTVYIIDLRCVAGIHGGCG